jgi:citrate synthase
MEMKESFGIVVTQLMSSLPTVHSLKFASSFSTEISHQSNSSSFLRRKCKISLLSYYLNTSHSKDEMIVHEKIKDFYKGFNLNAHPMSIMCGVVGALASFYEYDAKDIVSDPMQRELSAIKLIAKMPTLTAIAFRTSKGLPIVYPDKKRSYTENFLHMMFSDPLDPDFRVRTLSTIQF